MSSMSVKAQGRHRSREIALQLIYQINLRPETDIEQAINLYPSEGEEKEVFEYASGLVRGVAEHSDKITAVLRENIVSWRPERIVAVDKAAISLALYEGFIAETVPIPVAISEAVELAKAFGTEHSGRFVNGVLGSIARKEQKE